jgi:hypothetical protein
MGAHSKRQSIIWVDLAELFQQLESCLTRKAAARKAVFLVCAVILFELIIE